MNLWSNRQAKRRFRKGLLLQMSEGNLCGLCTYFSRNKDWGWCHHFFSEWHDQFLHEEFGCKHFELSPEFQSYKREHPGECNGMCEI